MHEIITLQLGSQSNYVATHFWNAQESYFTYGQEAPSPVDHDVHWRAGLGADGSETYLPRTVVYDRKGGFGSLRKVNVLYDVEAAQQQQQAGGGSGDYAALQLPPPSSSSSFSSTAAARLSLWGGRTIVERAPPIAPSAYTQSLDAAGGAAAAAAPLTPAAVRYWSDYSRVYLHPRSLVEVDVEPEVAATTATSSPSPSWADGERLFSALDREHDLLDRDLRRFAEEADHLQGLQVLASVDDSWGGFAARYLERMRDEYGKATIWLWALQQQQQQQQQLPRAARTARLANTARSLVEAAAHASLVVPLAVPPLLPPPSPSPRGLRPGVFDPAVPWHAAALLATAVETATLPTRLRAGAGAASSSLADLVDLLNATGKQTVAHLQMSVVQPWRQVARASVRARARDRDRADDGTDADADAGLRLPIDLAPQDLPARRGGRPPKSRMFGQAVVTRHGAEDDDGDGGDGGDDGADGNKDSHDPYDTRDPRDRMYRRLALKPVSQRFSVPLGFPLLDSFPAIYASAAGTGTGASVPVTTALATDRAVADRLQGLRAAVAMGGGALGVVGREDREALGNDLAGLADAYHDGWSSGSDDGDDD